MYVKYVSFYEIWQCSASKKKNLWKPMTLKRTILFRLRVPILPPLQKGHMVSTIR